MLGELAFRVVQGWRDGQYGDAIKVMILNPCIEKRRSSDPY
tara:strand:+ start:1421 stop:1543 length:123 start_codon:yes stop_codon:yes gene_type:complete